MAHPYILNPGQCGHTFCGLCILKWFFSRLHVTCGGWHESVDCPICRSLLVITPDQPPRPNTTFPFVPNRIATAVCESLIEKLAKYPPGSRLTVKREDSEGALGPGAGWDMVCNRKEGMAKLEEGKPVETTGAAGWKEGGTIRAEWLKKNRQVDSHFNMQFSKSSLFTRSETGREKWATCWPVGRLCGLTILFY